jgi:DNA-binding MurR/RpiR family transcriptional regulator
MFRDRIKAVYTDLSPSFQRLADYLVDHQYEAAFLTATQLGKQLSVDTATVVRFAQRLGYPGYPELLDEVQAEVRVQLARYFQPIAGGGDDADMFRTTLRQELAHIEQFDLMLDRHVIERMIELIDAADHIHTIGEGLSQPLATLLARTLHLMLYDVSQLPTEPTPLAAEFRRLTPRSLIIGVAVSPYCPDATGALQVAGERGARTLAFVGALSWPIARAVDLAVLCPNVGPAKAPSFGSFSAAIGALFQTLLHKHRAKLVDQLVPFEDNLRRLLDARNVVEILPMLEAAIHELQLP